MAEGAHNSANTPADVRVVVGFSKQKSVKKVNLRICLCFAFETKHKGALRPTGKKSRRIFQQRTYNVRRHVQHRKLCLITEQSSDCKKPLHLDAQAFAVMMCVS